MKKSNAIKSLGVGCASLALTTALYAGPIAPAPAPPPPPPMEPISDELGFTLSIGYDSDYIFRGVKIGKDLFWAGLDYERGITEVVSLSLGSWFGTLVDGNTYNEVDLYGGLSFAVTEAFSVGVGYIGYLYPNTDGIDDTGEVYGTLGYEWEGLGTELYYGYDHEIEGGYAALTAGYGYSFTEMIGIDLSAGVSYTHDYNFSGSGFNNVDLRLGLPIALTQTATLEPYIAGTFAIDKLEDVGEDDHFYGGVSLSVTF